MFFVSSDAVYAIGPKTAKTLTGLAVDAPARKATTARRRGCRSRPPSWCSKPGQTVKLHAKALRREGPIPARGDRRDVGASGLEGHRRRRWIVHRRRRSRRTGRHDQGHRRRASAARRARASCIRCRGPKRSSAYADGAVPAGWINAVAGKFSVDDARRAEGPAEGAGQHDLQAPARLHRPDRLVQLHHRSRRPRDDAAAADVGHRASRRSATRSCSTATRSS